MCCRDEVGLALIELAMTTPDIGIRERESASERKRGGREEQADTVLVVSEHGSSEQERINYFHILPYIR
jgi:hypothetical protein